MQVQVRVESDPARLLQPTESTSATATPLRPAFRPLHGYSGPQITSDRRFRATEAMRARGLLDKAAGQAALRSVFAQTAPRRLDSLTMEEQLARGAARPPR